MSQTELRSAQNDVSSLHAGAVSVPPMMSAGIVVKKEVDGEGQKAFFVTNRSGRYIFQGVYCDTEMKERLQLGGFSITIRNENSPSGYSAQIFDSNVYWSAMNQAPPVCSVEAFRIGGSIEALKSDLNGPPVRLRVSEPLLFNPDREEVYSLIDMIPQTETPETVILGDRIFGQASGSSFLPSSLGSKVLNLVYKFPVGWYLPEPGPTSLTKCVNGKCLTGVYQREYQLSNGKG